MGRFRAVLAVEDEPTADGRIIESGALTWRDPPLTLMAMLSGLHPMFTEDFVAGRMDTITRDGNSIVAEGEYDTSEQAVELERMVGERTVTGVSIDSGDAVVEYDDVYDEEGNLVESSMRMLKATILAATVTPVPAIGGAYIENVGAAAPPLEDDQPADEPADEAATEEAIAAAHAIASSDLRLAPPAEWFDQPELDGPTPLTVTADGRVFGHLAAWDACHTGFPGKCVTPPMSAARYAWFRLGSVLTADGDEVPVGTLTMNTGHAPLTSSYSEAVAHYDHTGLAAAYVAAGEDEHGIWLAGAVAPDLDESQIVKLRASQPSGDWRRVDGQLELAGALAVNRPGYPIRRLAMTASSLTEAPEAEDALALVAHGVVHRDAAVRRAAGRAAHRIGVGARTVEPYRRVRLADAARRVA